jgi:hypothetical protein
MLLETLASPQQCCDPEYEFSLRWKHRLFQTGSVNDIFAGAKIDSILRQLNPFSTPMARLNEALSFAS